MQNKTILDLPTSVTNEISQYLSTRDLLNVVETSRQSMQLFKTNKYSMQTNEIRKFLHHVVRGHHAVVAQMLKNPELMFKRGQVTDLSGRIFTNISGFEYALWALDKHMWTKMLSCLPENEEGEKIKSKLMARYQKVKELGVTYTLHGVTEHYMPETVTKTEKHFDFEGTIFKELQEYIDNHHYNQWHNQWQTGVGGAQRLLPMHVVHEYCSDRPFDPVPDFKGQPKSSTQFENYSNNGEKESWFRDGSKLGFDFAIYKGALRGGLTLAALAGDFGTIDLNALKALYKERTEDFLALEDDLKPNNSPVNEYKN